MNYRELKPVYCWLFLGSNDKSGLVSGNGVVGIQEVKNLFGVR